MGLIKSTYKSTEIGLIPEDWDVVRFNEIGEAIIGLTYSPSDISESGKLVHRSSNIQNNRLSYLDNVFVSCSVPDKLILQKGDILICVRNGSRELIGKSAIIDGASIGETFGAFMSVFRTKSYSPLIYQFVLSEIVQKQINASLGATINQITNKTLNEFIIPLPPTHTEQKAIATALSDVDALISSLEKLIAKKKAIKQGAMQELLTPKYGWKTKTIKEVATYRRGSFPQPYGLSKWYDDITGMPFVQVVDVGNNRKLKPETKQRISAEGAKMSVFVKKGSVILTIQGSIGRICITQYDAYVDRTLLIFESFSEEFNKYFFMIIVHQKFEIEKEKAPGGIIKTITKESLSSFEISYPIIDEQNRIAQILSEMDLEIESLENKKAKYQEIKQGMMQELLTGKTRLFWN